MMPTHHASRLGGRTDAQHHATGPTWDRYRARRRILTAHGTGKVVISTTQNAFARRHPITPRDVPQLRRSRPTSTLDTDTRNGQA
jgi:hypothetical protein